MSYFVLILLLASVLVPTSVRADNGCGDGVCGVAAELTPDSGTVGTHIILTLESSVSTLDGPYQIVWSKTPISEETDAIVLAEGRVDKGSYEITASFTVPEAVYGTNYVQFRRQYRPEDPHGFLFKVEPSIKVSPSSASPGSTATISGAGFTANDDIELSFDGKATDMTITTNDLGSFTAQFTLPDTIAGNHSFETTAQTIFGKDATASLKVVPGISLEPELPEIGEEVTLTGYGFAANSEVSIKYDGTTVANSPATDEVGNFTHSFTIPEGSEAEHEIIATDKAGNTATFSLPLEGEAPPAPTTVSPRQQRFGWLGSQVVTFSWTEVADPSGTTYTLEIGDNLNFFPLAPGMRRAGLTQPTCIIKLGPGTYYWRVKAIDGAGNESEWSLSPSAFKVGFFSIWYLVIGGFILLLVAIFIIRAFFRRISEYYS